MLGQLDVEIQCERANILMQTALAASAGTGHLILMREDAETVLAALRLYRASLGAMKVMGARL